MKKKVQKKKNFDTDIRITEYIDVSVNIAKKEFSQESRRHMSVLGEEFQGRVGEMGKRFDDFDKTLSGVKDEVSEIKQEVLEIKNTQNSHTEMIGKLMTDVEIIKKNVEFLKGGLKKKVDYDEFLALERRLTILESKTK